MDPMAQLSQKFNTEQTNQSLHQQLHQQQQPTPDSAPPPYMPSEHDDYEDDSDDDEDNDSDHHHHYPPPSPLKLTLNAAHNIQGSNNLVPTSPSPLADATRFSTLLLAAVKQLNSVAASEPLTPPSSSSRRSPASKRGAPLTVDLTINCGVTIVGDRNVVGNVCLKPKAPAQAFAGPAAAQTPASNPTTAATSGAADHAVVGAKRKAPGDEDDVGREGRYAKKVAMG
ncbi:hypothetical protein KC356_g7147 [Hortaea werneckii]|nr:hypothetical protein KC356_g7147 [Hortaea werneckii]